MREEIHPGINGYWIRFLFDDNDNCVLSEDSEGRISEHEFDSQNRLIKTQYKSGFWKTWNCGVVPPVYSDSDGSGFFVEDGGLRRGFHGTTVSNLASIKKMGFIPSETNWEQSTGNVFVFSNDGKYSDGHCSVMAEKYAKHSALKTDDIPVVVEIDITGLDLKKVSVDYYDPSYEILGSVDPERIRSWRVVDK